MVWIYYKKAHRFYYLPHVHHNFTCIINSDFKSSIYFSCNFLFKFSSCWFKIFLFWNLCFKELKVHAICTLVSLDIISLSGIILTYGYICHELFMLLVSTCIINILYLFFFKSDIIHLVLKLSKFTKMFIKTDSNFTTPNAYTQLHNILNFKTVF